MKTLKIKMEQQERWDHGKTVSTSAGCCGLFIRSYLTKFHANV